MPGAWYVDLVAVLVLAVAPIAARVVMHLMRFRGYSLRSLDLKRVLAIGSAEENKHALDLLWQTHFGLGRQRQMSLEEGRSPEAADEIRRRIRKHDIDEVVFCAKDLRWANIIHLMEQLRPTGVMFKIAQPAREFIIGPNSIESLNDLFIMERYAVNSSAGRRSKRILDLTLVVLLGLLMPVVMALVKDRSGFLRNWWAVLQRRKSWVGLRTARGEPPETADDPARRVGSNGR
jgi:hypothetical protein